MYQWVLNCFFIYILQNKSQPICNSTKTASHSVRLLTWAVLTKSHPLFHQWRVLSTDGGFVSDVPMSINALYLAAESVCCPSVRTATCGCPKVMPHSRSTSWTVNPYPQQHRSAGTWLTSATSNSKNSLVFLNGSCRNVHLHVPQDVVSDSFALREELVYVSSG